MFKEYHVPNAQEIVEKIKKQKDEEEKDTAQKQSQQSVAINFFNRKEYAATKNHSFFQHVRPEQIEQVARMAKK